MIVPFSRRQFLRTASAGSVFGMGNLAAFLPLAPAAAADSVVTPDIVRYSADIEPLVRLIEDTPIEQCPEMLASQLRQGLPYRRFLAALFLAALRGPSTIAHSVFVIHSVHQLGLDAPAEERLLPLFWALNNYKYWFNWHAKNPDRLRPCKAPARSAENGEQDFHAAMDQVDYEKAEAALLAMIRTQGLNRVAEALLPYGAKDNVDVGHNAITVANTWRVLPTIGEQHAEPILRWVLGRLMSKGDSTYEPNRERVRQARQKLPTGWAARVGDAGLTRELLDLMRNLKSEETCQLVVERLTEGKARAGAVWDAVHLHAAEVMMRKPDDGHPLHANTAANALDYSFRMGGDPSNRLLVLLQSIGWQCQHRRRKTETDPQWRASNLKIDELEGAHVPNDPKAAVHEILAGLPSHQGEAAAMLLTLGRNHADSDLFMQAARRAVLTKASENAHDVKFPVAVFEDYCLADARWRPHILAAAVYWLKGSETPDSSTVQQAREAVRKL